MHYWNINIIFNWIILILLILFNHLNNINNINITLILFNHWILIFLITVCIFICTSYNVWKYMLKIVWQYILKSIMLSARFDFIKILIFTTINLQSDFIKSRNILVKHKQIFLKCFCDVLKYYFFTGLAA